MLSLLSTCCGGSKCSTRDCRTWGRCTPRTSQLPARDRPCSHWLWPPAYSRGRRRGRSRTLLPWTCTVNLTGHYSLRSYHNGLWVYWLSQCNGILIPSLAHWWCYMGGCWRRPRSWYAGPSPAEISRRFSPQTTVLHPPLTALQTPVWTKSLLPPCRTSRLYRWRWRGREYFPRQFESPQLVVSQRSKVPSHPSPVSLSSELGTSL